MKNLRPIFLIATVVLLTACSRLTAENLGKVHNGMSATEVKAILGSPSDTQTQSMLGLSATIFVYHSSSSEVKITFLNDKVMALEGEFK